MKLRKLARQHGKVVEHVVDATKWNESCIKNLVPDHSEVRHVSRRKTGQHNNDRYMKI